MSGCCTVEAVCLQQQEHMAGCVCISPIGQEEWRQADRHLQGGVSCAVNTARAF